MMRKLSFAASVALVIALGGFLTFRVMNQPYVPYDPNAHLPHTEIAKLTTGQPVCVSVIAFHRQTVGENTEYYVEGNYQAFTYSPNRCSIRLEKGTDGTLGMTAPPDLRTVGDEIKSQEELKGLIKVDKQDFTATRGRR
jgi:hypothetical protein